MVQRLGENKGMPDVPKLDLTGALAEFWLQINYAAYHMAYVRVYSQSAALQTNVDQLRGQNQEFRDLGQIDIIICRTHLAAFFWHLEHVFEIFHSAITRGKKEHPELRYFYGYEKFLDQIEEDLVRQEIKDYRNMSHENPGIIGCRWSEEQKFSHHFLPTIRGHRPKEDVEMNALLVQYFEFAANVWLDFVPEPFKTAFPRDFKFPVTVPYSFVGELPEGLETARQLEVSVESYQRRSPTVAIKDIER